MSENEQKDAPQLKLCAAEWTLMRHPSAEKEWSMEKLTISCAGIEIES